MLDAALLCLLPTFFDHSFGMLEALWALSKQHKTLIIGGLCPPLQDIEGAGLIITSDIMKATF